MKNLINNGRYYAALSPRVIVPSGHERTKIEVTRERQLAEFANYLGCNKIGPIFASPIARCARDFGKGREYALANYNADIIGFYQLLGGTKTIFVLHDHERKYLDDLFVVQPSYVLLHPDRNGKYILDGFALKEGKNRQTGIFYKNQGMLRLVLEFAKNHSSFLVIGARSTANEVITGFSDYLKHMGMPQKIVSIADDHWKLVYPFLPGNNTKKL